MTNRQERTRIRALLEEIPAALELVQVEAGHAGLTGKPLHNCQLAVDEACTNVIEHAYGGGGPDQVIDVVCSLTDDWFSIEIIDDGPAFDPLLQPYPDPATRLEQREVGGWGIHFIRNLVDRVIYERRDERNHLCLMMQRSENAAADSAKASGNQVSVTEITDTLKVITLSGRLDAAVSDRLEKTLIDGLNSGGTYLVLDLGDVPYISSSGLKMLVSIWKRARDAKGDLILAGMQPGLHEMLRLIGFDLVFTFFDTPDEATAHYQQQS